MSTTVTSDRYDRRAADLSRKEIVTPEGVPLVLTIGRAGDRAAAFLVDTLLWVLPAALVIAVAIASTAGGVGAGYLLAACLFAVFLLRNGYFMFFELRWQGRTPGKRILGLRVVDARGGTLEADQVIARNLTREVETFVPLVALLAPEHYFTVGPGWVRALSVLWLAIFLVLPLLNRDRRRVGDLLAGTIVVRDPRVALRRDLLAQSADRRGLAAELAFTRAQLEMYGVYELQVLEDLLRNEARRSEALDVVDRKVRRKIGWRSAGGPEPSAREFLEAFYRAQRTRLEQGLVLGKARERKREGRLGQ